MNTSKGPVTHETMNALIPFRIEAVKCCRGIAALFRRQPLAATEAADELNLRRKVFLPGKSLDRYAGKPVTPSLMIIALSISACTSQSDVRDPDPVPSDWQALPDGPPSTPVVAKNIPPVMPRPEPLSQLGNPPFYEVDGQRYFVLPSSHGYRERGIASWYGRKFHGRRASNGETYDMYALSAAHKTLPLPSYVEVTNLENGRKIVVRVNDRGPFVKNRLIDLSYAAARKLGIFEKGTGLVEVRALSTAAGPSARAAAHSPPQRLPQIFIQVGAFADPANAESLRDRLQTETMPPIRIQPFQKAGKPLYRVQLGPIESIDEVDRVTEVLPSLGIPDHQVVIN